MISSTLSPRSRPPVAAIRLGISERSAAERRHGLWLVRYMRVLALFWLIQGLLVWALVLLAGGEGAGAFSATPDLAIGVIILFAVLDLVAAVGLWLIAAWGGVLWLAAVAAQWFTAATLPGFFPYDITLSVLDVVLVAGYFTLTYKAAGEIEH